MIDFRIRAAVAPIVLAAAALASASASAAPIVSFAQGAPNAAHPCATESAPGANDIQGLCTVPAAVNQARTAWLANVAGPSFEEFETAGSRQLGAPALFAGGATMTSTGVDAEFFNDPLVGTSFPGRFNTTGNGGAAGWWFESGSGVTTIRFANPIEAFGFYLTDLGDEGGSASVSLFSGQTALAGGLNLAVTARGINGEPLPLLTSNNSVLFFGVTSDGNPFDRITLNINLSRQGGNDFVGLDSLIIGNVDTGTPLPTPGTLALAGLALLGLRRFHAKR